jgi:hypothetical protein
MSAIPERRPPHPPGRGLATARCPRQARARAAAYGPAMDPVLYGPGEGEPPAGWESYMRDVAKAARSGPLTPEVLAGVASRYDFDFVR